MFHFKFTGRIQWHERKDLEEEFLLARIY
uniref:Uncharacterized protein n=1 Tax=Rhizophora mucronata TaxID=61149 RepID=A0A2P2N9G5_RHIMU